MGKGETRLLQNQIRNNANELQDYFNDLNKWENAIKKSETSKSTAAIPPKVTFV